MNKPFSKSVTPNWEEFLFTIHRLGTPKRVHHIELFLDGEVKDELCDRHRLGDGINFEDPFYKEKREIAIQRFLGYDYVADNPQRNLAAFLPGDYLLYHQKLPKKNLADFNFAHCHHFSQRPDFGIN